MWGLMHNVPSSDEDDELGSDCPVEMMDTSRAAAKKKLTEKRLITTVIVPTLYAELGEGVCLSGCTRCEVDYQFSAETRIVVLV